MTDSIFRLHPTTGRPDGFFAATLNNGMLLPFVRLCDDCQTFGEVGDRLNWSMEVIEDLLRNSPMGWPLPDRSVRVQLLRDLMTAMEEGQYCFMLEAARSLGSDLEANKVRAALSLKLKGPTSTSFHRVAHRNSLTNIISQSKQNPQLLLPAAILSGSSGSVCRISLSSETLLF